ncbi:MAG: MBL fold metallo-hydrolase [Actinomycetota bacterium]
MLAVRILGCSGSYAAAGGACTGYLVQSAEAKVWLDTGPGTMSNLQHWTALAELDAIVLTHAHPDHWLDLPTVAIALEWHQARSKLPVFSNAHMFAEARHLIGDAIEQVFDWQIVGEDSVATIGDQTWTFAETEHYVPTNAVRAESGGQSLVFTGDTGPGFSMANFAERCGAIDMALIESTFLDREGNEGILHLSASEAGEMAASAGVRRLVLTHLLPGEEGAAHVEAAQRHFGGDVVLAEVGGEYAAPSS